MTGPGVTQGLADLHCHLVPGVDDGARDLDEALAGLGRLVAAGVRQVVATPHLDASLEFRASALDGRLSQLDEGFRSLAAAAAEHYPEVELHLGCEVLLDVPDPVLDDPRLHLGATRFVLVEWPRLRVPPGTVQVVGSLRDRGVVPVIAHPERYRGTGRRMALAEEWRRAGALLQVNHGSLHGRYGREALERAMILLEQGWADLLASDFHGRAHLEPYVVETRQWFERRRLGAAFGDLTAGNPHRMMNDEMPMSLPPLEVRTGALDRLKSLLNLKGSSS